MALHTRACKFFLQFKAHHPVLFCLALQGMICFSACFMLHKKIIQEWKWKKTNPMPGNNIDFVNSKFYKLCASPDFFWPNMKVRQLTNWTCCALKKMKSKVKVNLWKFAEGDRAVSWTQNAVISPEIEYWLNNALQKRKSVLKTSYKVILKLVQLLTGCLPKMSPCHAHPAVS